MSAELLILHFPAVYHTPITPTTNQSIQSLNTAIEEAILTLSLANSSSLASRNHDVLLDHLITLILIEANLPATLAEVSWLAFIRVKQESPFIMHKVLEETVKMSHHDGVNVSQQFGLVLCAAGKEKVSTLSMLCL